MKKEKKSEVTNKVKNIETDENLKVVAPENNPVVEEIKKPAEAVPVTKVGSLLKNVRLEKGLKLIDIAKTLCIRKQYLEAIEDNDYNEIPAFPYGIGFIRSYATFLGLNSENIAELYKEETSSKDTQTIVVTEVPASNNMPGFVYIVVSIVALIVIYGVWKIWNNDAENVNDTYIAEDTSNDSNDIVIIEETSIDADTSSDAPVDEIETPEEPKIADKQPDKVEVSVQQPQEEEQPKQESLTIPEKGIFIEVLEETWIEVKTDTKLYLSKVLQPGDSYILPNDEGLILSVGKLGGVNVYVNGKKTDLAQSGRKMNIDIDAYIKANH